MGREEIQCMKHLQYFKHFEIYVALLKGFTVLYTFVVIVLDVELL